MRNLVVASALLFFISSAFAQDKSQRPNADDLKKIQAALPEKPPATPKKPRKLLIFTKATGFVHSSIPVGAKAFELMGDKTGAYSTIVSDDPESFAPDPPRSIGVHADQLRERRTKRLAGSDFSAVFRCSQ